MRLEQAGLFMDNAQKNIYREVSMQRSSPDPAAMPASNRRPSVPRRLMAVIAASLLLQGCASNPPAPSPAETAHAEAKAAYLANNYQRTLAIVEPLAIGGEPWAQYTLGYMYYYGRGIATDRQMAKLWIQRAAQEGYGPAQQALQRLSRHKAPAANNEEGMEPPSAKPVTPPGQAVPSSPPGETPAAPPAGGSAAGGTSMPDTAKPEPSPEDVNPSTAPQQNPKAAPPPSTPDDTAPAAPASPPPAPPETAPPQPTPPAAAPIGPADNGIKGRDWIDSQDPQHYTVQLIAVGSEAAAVRFIHNRHLEGEAAYYAQTRNGKPWYSVIYGSYPDREAARQALRRLPPALSSASPWVRRFGDIQLMLETLTPNDKK
jgi:septal ring-binding cell division protein DamX